MIKLRFVTRNGPVSNIIRAVTWSDFSHVDLVLPEGLLGAQLKGGVQIRPWNYYKPTRVGLGLIDCDPMTASRVIDFCKDQLRKPYDLSALFGQLFHRDWTQRNAWFCSELFAAAFDQAGYPLVDRQINRVTPQDLVESTKVRVIIEPTL